MVFISARAGHPTIRLRKVRLGLYITDYLETPETRAYFKRLYREQTNPMKFYGTSIVFHNASDLVGEDFKREVRRWARKADVLILAEVGREEVEFLYEAGYFVVNKFADYANNGKEFVVVCRCPGYVKLIHSIHYTERRSMVDMVHPNGSKRYLVAQAFEVSGMTLIVGYKSANTSVEGLTHCLSEMLAIVKSDRPTAVLADFSIRVTDFEFNSLHTLLKSSDLTHTVNANRSPKLNTVLLFTSPFEYSAGTCGNYFSRHRSPYLDICDTTTHGPLVRREYYHSLLFDRTVVHCIVNSHPQPF